MDDDFNLYGFDENEKRIYLETFHSKGVCSLHTSGMCGDIFVFDQGEYTIPRYTCIKVPKPLKNVCEEETTKRFIRELKLQLSFYHNKFVHWPYDFESAFNVPIAYFRYWGNDLANLIRTSQPSQVTKLSIMVYTCVGLRHCYNRGLVAHQDLKPANIFIQNIKNDFSELPNLDIYDFAIVADFGLANAFIDYQVFDGSRPYMSPEQWNQSELSQASDIFALGVIYFELITYGYHPVGIKLSDFWPKPHGDNIKKWTRADAWQKWINNGCQITLPEGIIIDPDTLDFIKKMLSIQASLRPGLDEVIEFLLKQIKDNSEESHLQLTFLINHFEEESSKMNNLEKDWPYLFTKWEKLKVQFE
jgi:serine/threonine protein kinase